jgi:cobalt-zinc-cadmium efflux system membrane fusion protein
LALWVALGCCSLGCRSQQAPAPGPIASASGSSTESATPRRLKIDPALFRSERVATTKVDHRGPSAALELPGEVRASLAAAEVGALVSGRIAAVSVVEGARVERGQVLAWLDAPEVARATAEVLRARARAASTSNKLKRQLELEQQQATSKNALDDARTEAEVARADLLAARTLLRSLGGVEPPATADPEAASLSARVALRAPVSGVVVRRDAVLGGAVTPERTLFWLSGNAAPLVLAHVPEGVPPPSEGELAALRARGATESCSATVRGQLGVVDRETRSVDVRVEPDAACQGLLPGAFVDVTFRRTTSGGVLGLLVPREAVVEVRGVSLVFVVQGPGEVAVTPVRLAERPGPEALVESGLRAGDEVVTRGAVLFKGELLRAELTGD